MGLTLGVRLQGSDLPRQRKLVMAYRSLNCRLFYYLIYSAQLSGRELALSDIFMPCNNMSNFIP